jgi:hypothetical protein
LLTWILPSSTSSDERTMRTAWKQRSCQRRRLSPELHSCASSSRVIPVHRCTASRSTAPCALYRPNAADPHARSPLPARQLIPSMPSPQATSSYSPVSFLFLPRTEMVSPLKSWRSSIVAGLMDATELSSEDDSSTMSRFGLDRGSTGVSSYSPRTRTARHATLGRVTRRGGLGMRLTSSWDEGWRWRRRLPPSLARGRWP